MRFTKLMYLSGPTEGRNVLCRGMFALHRQFHQSHTTVTLLHDVNLVMSRMHGYSHESRFNFWLQKTDLPSKFHLLSRIAGLFRSINSAANTYKITKQSQFSTWLTDQMATGFQHITNSHDKFFQSGSFRGAGASNDQPHIVQSDPYHRTWLSLQIHMHKIYSLQQDRKF